jgi:hypothetical protein
MEPRAGPRSQRPTERPDAPWAGSLVRWAALVVRLAAAWVLLGALAKLFGGTPADLPQPLRELAWPDVITFGVAIAVELAVGAVAWLRPRAGWAPLALLLAAFTALAGQAVADGAPSCGCFGSAIAVAPGFVLAVDIALLAALLACRPWRSSGAGAKRGWLIASAGAALLAPWPLLRSVAPPSAPVMHAVSAWELPAELPRWISLKPAGWVGKPIGETELGRWVDTARFPQDATWILYRLTCTHCRDHFKELAAGWDGRTEYVFVRLREADEEQRNVIEERPPGTEIVLPAGPLYTGYTPWDVVLDRGIVKEAVFRGEEPGATARPGG